jgi:hypothetical protein
MALWGGMDCEERKKMTRQYPKEFHASIVALAGNQASQVERAASDES